MNANTTSLIPFAFGENIVRIVTDENGNPWFMAKDVCRVLGLDNVGQAISTLDEDERSSIDPNIISADVGMDVIFKAGIFSTRTGIPEAGRGGRPLALVTESGVYALVFRSRKPEARAFSKWVRSEVLPTLRKTGRYAMPRRQARRESMPDNLPAEVLALRPSMRQKLWQDALQTARLDGSGSEAAWEWFLQLCRMVAALPPAPSPARDKVQAFYHECCQEAPGNRVPVKTLYDAFRSWHRTQRGDLPSMKLFGTYLQELARRFRSNGSLYEGLCLKPYSLSSRNGC